MIIMSDNVRDAINNIRGEHGDHASFECNVDDVVWDVVIGPEYDNTYYVDMYDGGDRHLHHYCGAYPPNADEAREIVDALLEEAAR